MFIANKNFLLLATVVLAGCSTIVSGRYQNIHISTECDGTPVPMTCNLSNQNGSWNLNTPGGTVIQRGYGSLTINCSNGYVASIDSSVKAWTFGNIPLWGAGGVIVDVYTGSGFDYPEKVKVTIPACHGQTPQVNRWWR
jgi:hypothetical protein